MAEPSPRIVVTVDRPKRRRLLFALIAALLLLLAYSVYRLTRATAASEIEQTASERDRLLAERRQLARALRDARAELSTLRDEVAYSRRSREIDDSACASVKESLADLQAKSSDLREQLAFYRGIVSPQESQAGVRVYEFHVRRAAADPALWHYDLVLIQPVRSDKRVGGRFDISFEGLLAGATRRLSLADVAVRAPAEERGQSLVFSFRYFEEFSGEVRFPPGFRPLRAIVALTPAGDGQAAVEDEYEWAKVAQEAKSR